MRRGAVNSVFNVFPFVSQLLRFLFFSRAFAFSFAFVRVGRHFPEIAPLDLTRRRGRSRHAFAGHRERERTDSAARANACAGILIDGINDKFNTKRS